MIARWIESALVFLVVMPVACRRPAPQPAEKPAESNRDDEGGLPPPPTWQPDDPRPGPSSAPAKPRALTGDLHTLDATGAAQLCAKLNELNETNVRKYYQRAYCAEYVRIGLKADSRIAKQKCERDLAECLAKPFKVPVTSFDCSAFHEAMKKCSGSRAVLERCVRHVAEKPKRLAVGHEKACSEAYKEPPDESTARECVELAEGCELPVKQPKP